jgi:hypothetical protein
MFNKKIEKYNAPLITIRRYGPLAANFVSVYFGLECSDVRLHRLRNQSRSFHELLFMSDVRVGTYVCYVVANAYFSKLLGLAMIRMVIIINFADHENATRTTGSFQITAS